MYKKDLKKTSYNFLKNQYPENLIPKKKFSKKQKRIVSSKKAKISLKKRIQKVENFLQNKNTVWQHEIMLCRYSSQNSSHFQCPSQSLRSTTLTKAIFDTDASLCDASEIPTPSKMGPSLSSVLKIRSSLRDASVSSMALVDYVDQRVRDDSDATQHYPSSTILKKRKVYYLYSLQQIKYELYRKGKRDKNSSHFLHMLKEKKKLSLLYGGISNLFFQKVYNETLKIQGKFTQNLLIFLEKRLDVILYRICFCKSIAAARQAINHNLILVNGRVVNISSYIVKAGDILTVNKKHSNFFKKTIYNTIQNSIYKRRSRLVLPQGLLQNFLKSLQKDKKKILYSLQRNTKNNNQFDYLNILSQIEKFFLYKKIKKFSSTEKQKYKYCLYKQYLSKYRSRRHKLTAMQISAMKPINIEISYKILTAIILFSPQKLFFPALIDLELIKRFFD